MDDGKWFAVLVVGIALSLCGSMAASSIGESMGKASALSACFKTGRVDCSDQINRTNW